MKGVGTVGKKDGMRVEILPARFHFLTMTDEGLEILGEPSGEKSVMSDTAALFSLQIAVGEWLEKRVCFNRGPARFNGDCAPVCMREREHEGMHGGMRYNPGRTAAEGWAEWSDYRRQDA